MAQHDFNIANQGFPAFRSDLNDVLTAINTSQSGTTIPTGAAAGTVWLDTTSATTPTLKFYDGTEQVSIEYAIDNKFEDIVLSVHTNGTIQIESTESIFHIIMDYDDMKKMWELVEEYYESEEGEEIFNKFAEKNVWEK